MPQRSEAEPEKSHEPRVRVSAEAVELIRHSLELAGADPAEVGVRLRVAGGVVRPRFVPAAQEGDTVVEIEGLRIFVAKDIVDELGGVEVVVTPEHSQLEVRSL